MCRMYSQMSIHTTHKGAVMSRVEEINVQIAKLEEERKSAMLTERVNVLDRIKKEIKLYGFKTSDFKGVLATRAKRGTAKKVATKKAPK
jgi:hypothetical protein